MLMKVLVNGDWVTVCDFSNSGINENSLYVQSDKNELTTTTFYREFPGGLVMQGVQVMLDAPKDNYYFVKDIDLPKPFSEVCITAVASGNTTGNDCYCLNTVAYPRSNSKIRLGMRHITGKNLSGTVTIYLFCVGK